MPTVCIMGMHRSGTSLVARAINLLGVSLGDESLLLGGGRDNPAGFWESAPIVRFDDRLLDRLGGTWDAPPRLEPGWEADPDLADLREEAGELLSGVFGATDADWRGWKDPRLSLLLPFWRRVAQVDEGIICVRDPREVAASLARRNRIDEHWASFLWLRYTLGAVHAAPDAAVFHYEQALTQPDPFIDRLAAALGVDVSEDARNAIRGHIAPDLQHHHASWESDDPLTTFAQRVFRWLTAADEPGPEPHIVEAFATGRFRSEDPGVLGIASTLEGNLARTRVAVSEIRASRDEWRAKAEHLENAVEALGVRSTHEAEQRIQEVMQDRSTLRQQLEEAQGRASELEQRANDLEQRVHELGAAHDALEDQRDELLSEVEQSGARAARLEERLDEASRERRMLETRAEEADAQRRRANRLRDELGRAHENQRRLQDWMAELRDEVDKLLRSRRWRMGSALGDLVEWASPRRDRGKATDRITELLDDFTEWKEAEDAALARKRAGRDEPDDRAVSVDGDAGSGRATEVRPDSPAPPDVVASGVSAAEDRERRREIYQRWIEDIEAAGRAEGPTVPAHVVVTLGKSSHPDEFDRFDAVRRTLVSAAEAGARATCVGHADPRLERAASGLGLDVMWTGDADGTIRGLEEDWYLVLEPGDEVATELPAALGATLAEGHGHVGALVCDRDVVRPDGAREDPVFAPAWSFDLFLEHAYPGRGVILRRETVLASGAPPLDVDACLMRLARQGTGIGKIDRVLVHQRPETDDVTARRDRAAARTRTLTSQLEPIGQVEVRRTPTGPRVSYRLDPPPAVSIIIPFKDRVDLLAQCVDSVLRWSTYPNYELLLVDNASEDDATADYLERVSGRDEVRVLSYDEEFNFSRLNNWAVERAEGEVLVFLNNDTKVVTHDWLEELVGYAVQPGVGLVGGILHFGNGRIQHGGVVVGLQGLAGHAFASAHMAHIDDPGIDHARNWSAVTAACAAVRRDRFLEVGGFDGSFVVTGSDVVLGLHLRREGYRNVVNPAVRLFHFEKQSRRELGVAPIDVRRSLVEYREDLRHGDPFWNRNLSLESSVPIPALGSRPSFADRRQQAMRTIDRRAPYTPDDAETGFLEAYDASQDELEANRRLLDRLHRDRDLELGHVTFFLPAFDHVYRGGIFTVMRIADHLTRTRGTRSTFVLISEPRIPVSAIGGQIAAAFPQLDHEVRVLDGDTSLDELEASDAGICTLWTSAYDLMRWQGCQGKFYLVQDYEPRFYAAGSVFGLIEQTYRFGFPGIANTEGVAEAYRRYGNPTHTFTPGIDREVFRPDDAAQPDDRIRITFYGRPGNPRNAFELGTRALRQVKERHGDRIEILSAGAEFNEIALGLDDVLTNLGVLPDIGSVADLYRSSHIGLVLMFSKHPSYQPLEYMASGCATVTNVNEANTWLLRDRENAVLAPATVTGLADAIDDLIGDRSLRERIVARGLATVERLDWEPQLEGIARFLETGETAR